MYNNSLKAKDVEYDSNLESLDKLIKEIGIKEYQLKSAVLAEDDDLIGKLDGEISSLLKNILDHHCTNKSERKMLLTYLFDRYLCDGEVRNFVPSGVMEKIKSLF